MAKKTWSERKAERDQARKSKQEVWAAHNTKHRPLLPEDRSRMPRPGEGFADRLHDELERVDTHIKMLNDPELES